MWCEDLLSLIILGHETQPGRLERKRLVCREWNRLIRDGSESWYYQHFRVGRARILFFEKFELGWQNDHHFGWTLSSLPNLTDRVLCQNDFVQRGCTWRLMSLEGQRKTSHWHPGFLVFDTPQTPCIFFDLWQAWISIFPADSNMDHHHDGFKFEEKTENNRWLLSRGPQELQLQRDSPDHFFLILSTNHADSLIIRCPHLSQVSKTLDQLIFWQGQRHDYFLLKDDWYDEQFYEAHSPNSGFIRVHGDEVETQTLTIHRFDFWVQQEFTIALADQSALKHFGFDTFSFNGPKIYVLTPPLWFDPRALFLLFWPRNLIFEVLLVQPPHQVHCVKSWSVKKLCSGQNDREFLRRIQRTSTLAYSLEFDLKVIPRHPFCPENLPSSLPSFLIHLIVRDKNSSFELNLSPRWKWMGVLELREIKFPN